MKFKIDKTIVVKSETVEYDLPRYAWHMLENSDIHYRITEGPPGLVTLTEINIDNHKSSVTIQVEHINTDLGRDGDYYLGLGEFESDAEGWLKAVKMAKEILKEAKL